MQISILLLVALLAAALIVGVFFGWNNGKASVISKIENEAKTLLGDAAAHFATFWGKVKAKL